MNCEQALELIGAAVDREIDDEQQTALDAHLSGCAECRDVEAALRKQDADLVRAFRPDRDRAARLAEQIIAELPVASPPRGQNSNWLALLLATAIGFLAAVLIFQPWQRPPQPVVKNVPSPGPDNGEIQVTTVARLVETTGDVQLGQRFGNMQNPQSALKCPSNQVVRTGAGVRCELVTIKGCVIRMDGETELTFADADRLQLNRGQIWCQLPKDESLEIVSGDGNERLQSGGAQPNTSAWSCTTPSPIAAFLTKIQPDGSVRVTTAGGEVSLTTAGGTHQLKLGETATIANGRCDTKGLENEVLSAVWMMPLLAKKGHHNEELSGRVNQLLANIGRSKLDKLYEQEIRNLGEFGVLPLVRFVQSPQSKQDPLRRGRAMNIISDLAPSWLIGDLIGLLDHTDPNVRFHAASALERLTGQDHGCTTAMWRAAAPESTTARTRWDTWWEENRDRFPMPKVPAPKESKPAS